MKQFVWIAVVFCAALVVFPQLVTRSASGDSLFDFNTDNDRWINRGVRVAALCTLAFFGVLYLTSKA
jgi:hypothetical protein